MFTRRARTVARRVWVAGLSGAAIGYGLIAIDCDEDCGTAQGVAGLMVGHELAVAFSQYPAMVPGSKHHPVAGGGKLLVADGRVSCAGSLHRCLVDQGGQVGAGETSRLGGPMLQVGVHIG